MRLNLDTPPISDNKLPADLNRWFTNIVDQLNFIFNNIIADRTGNIGGSGAGPLTISIPGMTIDSIVTGNIQSSTNPVSIQKLTSIANGFQVLLSGDPGASLLLNYEIYLSPVSVSG